MKRLLICLLVLGCAGCSQQVDFLKENVVIEKHSYKLGAKYVLSSKDYFFYNKPVFYGAIKFADVGDIIIMEGNVIKAIPPENGELNK